MIEDILAKIKWTITRRGLPKWCAFRVIGVVVVNKRVLKASYTVTKQEFRDFDSQTPGKDLEGLAKVQIKQKFRDVIHREELHYLDNWDSKDTDKR